MKQRFERFLSVLCAAILLLALVSAAACGKPGGSGSTTAAPADTAAPGGDKSTEPPEATPEQNVDTAAPDTGTNIGDVYVFGSYEQDGDASNGSEQIEWIILDKDGDSLLLISKYALDCKVYNAESTNVTWESCSLREWLNGEFVTAAFSAEEQQKLKSTTVPAGVNPKYDTPAGNDTVDRVFLLSIDETERYFAAGSSECGATEYAIAQGVSGRSGDKGTCCWWLRSPGDSGNYAAYVANGWGVTSSGERVTYDQHGVRPVLWVVP